MMIPKLTSFARQTAFVMIAETVSLGILSLPSTLKAVGLVP
jgi:hypothetical protein